MLFRSMLEGSLEGYDTGEDYKAKAQWLIQAHHMRPDEAMEMAYYDTDPETWAGSPWEDDFKQGVAESIDKFRNAVDWATGKTK